MEQNMVASLEKENYGIVIVGFVIVSREPSSHVIENQATM